jgi:putative SOS response-associated peptidase YedK
MCGRFTHRLSWAEIHGLYRLTLDPFVGRNDMPARFNICPTQSVPIVHNDKDGNEIAEEARWWLVPWWAKEMPKAAMFNARIETVATSGAFKDAFKSKRCLIPADGFYEWTFDPEDPKGKTKDPWYIHMPGGKPFSFAGLWAHNDKLGVTSCTIITREAEAPVSELHDRMPVILDPAVYDEWLAAETGEGDAMELLDHHLDGQMQFHRVSRDVNSSKFMGNPGIEINPL